MQILWRGETRRGPWQLVVVECGACHRSRSTRRPRGLREGFSTIGGCAHEGLGTLLKQAIC